MVNDLSFASSLFDVQSTGLAVPLSSHDGDRSLYSIIQSIKYDEILKAN